MLSLPYPTYPPLPPSSACLFYAGRALSDQTASERGSQRKKIPKQPFTSLETYCERGEGTPFACEASSLSRWSPPCTNMHGLQRTASHHHGL